VVIAAVQRVRRERGRVTAGNDRLETDVYAVKRLLYRLGHAERSGRFALSLDQLVAACARVMPWGPVPAAGGGERERFFRRHRASVQRWLSWLHDAGVVEVAPEQDSKGYWWRTVIELRGRPLVDVDALQAARARMNAWAGRDRRRRAKACPPRCLLAAIRRKASKPQRRTRAAVARSRARCVHEQRRRAAVKEAIAEATERRLLIEKDLGHPYGAPPTSAVEQRSFDTWFPGHAVPESVPSTVPSSFQRLRELGSATDQDGRAGARSVPTDSSSNSRRERQSTENGAAGRSEAPRALAGDGCPSCRSAREQTRWREDQAVRQAAAAARRVWRWPIRRSVPLGLLAEAWALARHGEERVAESWGRVGAGPQGRATDRQAAAAIALYEAFAEQRPPGWPAGGPAALLVLAGRGRATTLRGDLATLLILAKGMRAVALYTNLERVARARRRALKRAMPKQVRFAFRRPADRAGFSEPAELRRMRIRDEALLAGAHPGSTPTSLTIWTGLLTPTTGCPRRMAPAATRLATWPGRRASAPHAAYSRSATMTHHSRAVERRRDDRPRSALPGRARARPLDVARALQRGEEAVSGQVTAVPLAGRPRRRVARQGGVRAVGDRPRTGYSSVNPRWPRELAALRGGRRDARTRSAGAQFSGQTNPRIRARVRPQSDRAATEVRAHSV